MNIDFNKRIGIISMVSSHSLIVSNKPDKLTTDNIIERTSAVDNNGLDIQNLGLWDSSSPNYTTYYPDVTKEDLIPQDVDFIEPVFRCLSETVLFKYGVPIDFSKEGVLKASMSKLKGQTINVDHEVATGNAIGSVKDVFWQDSYKVGRHTIPAGINGIFKIDGKSNPRLVRGMMMEPPSIHSNSVSVRFKWEPSHDFESISEFYDKLGSYTKEGELVRLVVTEILLYTETSVVPHGADPYAQITNESGSIVNPEFAKGVYSFSSDLSISKQQQCLQFDYKISLESDLSTTIPLTKSNIETNHLNTNQNMDYLKQLSLLLGLEESELTDDNFVDKVKGHLSSLKQEPEELITLRAEKLRLETELADAKKIAPGFDKLLADLKEDTKKNYKLSVGEEAADQLILESIDKMEFSLLEATNKQYQLSVEKEYPLTCQDCSSHNISRASIKLGGKDSGNGGGKEKSMEEVMDDIRAQYKSKK